MRATKTVHVDAKPEEVFSFMLDSTVTPKGMTMEIVHETPDVVGTSYQWAFKMFGLPSKGVAVITDYVPNKTVVFQNFGAMEGTQTETVEPDNGGSKVTHEMDSRLAILVIGRFTAPCCDEDGKRTLHGASVSSRSGRKRRRQASRYLS